MNTYKIDENWEDFKHFVSKNLQNTDKSNIGFMHNESEIYVRSTDDRILDILRLKYQLTQSEQPKNFLDGDRDWGYFGNHALFDLKI